MQKIIFNDRYGLTQTVIEGRKTVTRRIEGGGVHKVKNSKNHENNN